MENSLRIKSIIIKSFKVLSGHEGGFVEFTVLVTGKTRFLHPLSVVDQELPTFTFTTRYSTLLNVHLELLELFPQSELPPFPGKKWFGAKCQYFQMKRIKKINFYFEEVLKNPLINSSEPIMRLISPDKSFHLAVIGEKNVGKQQVIQSFFRGFKGRQSFKNLDEDDIRCLPVDLLVDQKLYRVLSVVKKNFEEFSEESLNDALLHQHGAVFIYKNRGNAAYDIAVQMFNSKKYSFPCVMVNFEGDQPGEIHFRDQSDGLKVFTELIRVISDRNNSQMR